MSRKIVFLDAGTLSVGDINFTSLDLLGEVKMYDRTEESEVINRCRDGEIIITNKVVLDDNVISRLPYLKYICVTATGYNVVDVESATKHNIPVSNVSGYSTTSVVQQVFALVLKALNRVSYYNQEVQKGRWQKTVDFTFYDHSITELAGMTMGIFGFGTIGKQVGEVAKAFGMEVIAVKRSINAGEEIDEVRFVTEQQLFMQSDVISLHAPLTKETTGVINKSVLKSMKPTAILVNTGRGPLIVEQDLSDALKSKEIAFACLDVLSQEPPEGDNQLIGLDNCIITPHQAWASKESRQRLLDGLVDNIKNFQIGKVTNIVNSLTR